MGKKEEKRGKKEEKREERKDFTTGWRFFRSIFYGFLLRNGPFLPAVLPLQEGLSKRSELCLRSRSALSPSLRPLSTA